MKFILKMILSAVAVMILAEFLSGITIADYKNAVILAVVLTVLNAVVKPVCVFLTFPITIVTLGLFLLIINAAMVLLADYFLSGFQVDGWIWALIFSVLLSGFQSILYSVLQKDNN